MSESESGGAWSWKWLAAGAAVAAATAAVGLYVVGGSKQEHKKKTKKKKKKKKKKHIPPTHEPAKQEAKRVTLEEIAAATDEIQKGFDVSEHHMQMVKDIIGVSAKGESSSYRLAAVKFLAAHQEFAKNKKEYQEAQATLRESMKVAWDLLDCFSNNPDEARELEILRLDVARRLRDGEKVSSVYKRMMKKSEVFTGPQMTAVFLAAPELGRWQDFVQFTKRFMEHTKLDVFHETTLRRPDVPDYQVLYALACKEVEAGRTTGHGPLRYHTLRLTKIRIRLSEVESENKAVVEQILKKRKKGWIDTDEDSTILRTGHIAQMMSLSGIRMPLVGPAYDDHMMLKGYMRTPQGTQTDTYSLKRDGDGDKWVGHYTMKQRKDDVLTTMKYDVEMHMEICEN